MYSGGMRTSPNSKTSWTTGLAAGAAAGLVGCAAAEAVAALSGRSFPEVTPAAIAVASLLSNLGAGLLYWLLARRMSHAVTPYVVTTMALSVVYTAAVAAHHPAHPDFMTLVIPLHAVVTAAAVLVVPASAMRIQARRSETTTLPARWV